MASPENSIFTDSSADLDRETVKTWNINVVPLAITIGNNESFLDGETISTQEVVERMNGGDIPKTAALGDGVIKERFDRVDDRQIIAVFISSGISAVVNNATMAADEMEKEGKLRPAIIDSRTTSMALGFLTTKVAELNLQGMSAIDIQKYVEDMKKRTFAMVALPTIKYVAAGGRWLAGTLLQIKPILMVHSGKIEEVAKVRTWENTKERFLKIIQPMEFEQVAVMFSNNYTEAEEFKARVPAPRSNEVLVRQMGSTITTHAGKQVLAVCGILTSQSPVLTPAEAAKIKY